MKLRLLDYAGKETIVDIGNIEDIAVIDIEVVTGDEIAIVIYKDYKTARFDSSGCRLADFYDGGYTLYDISEGINLLDDPKYINRKSSYDYPCYWDEEDEE